MNKSDIHKLMHDEAAERMHLLGIDQAHLKGFMEEGELTIVRVRSVRTNAPTDYIVERLKPSSRVMDMVHKLEKDKQILVYYMICDEGVWSDGETFPRFAMLHVDKYTNDYKFAKEECIKRCKTVPAYVYNAEEDFIELTEIAFKNVEGLLVQIS